MNNNNLTDEQLIRLAAGHDESAFAELVRRYQERILNLAYRSTFNADEAEDITVEVFFNAWRYAKDFKGDAAFSTWLYRIAVNLCLNYKKKTGRAPFVSSLDEPVPNTDGVLKREAPEPHRYQPEQAAVAGERDALLWEAINALAPNQRMALVLSWFEGFSYKEIAAMMGVSVPAVESLLFRAKESLKKNVSPALHKP